MVVSYRPQSRSSAGQLNGRITRTAVGPPRLQSALVSPLDRPVRRQVTSWQTCHPMAHSVAASSTASATVRHEGKCRGPAPLTLTLTLRTHAMTPAMTILTPCARSAVRRPTYAPSTGPGPLFRPDGRVAIHPLAPSAAFRTATPVGVTGIEPLRPACRRPERRMPRHAVHERFGINSSSDPRAVGSVSFARLGCRKSLGTPTESSILVQEPPDNLVIFSSQ